MPFIKKTLSFARKRRQFLRLERATAAEQQGTSEDKKFAAKLTQQNEALFLINGVGEGIPKHFVTPSEVCR